MLKLLLAALTAALAAVVLAGALPGAAHGQSLGGQTALPDGPGKEAVEGADGILWFTLQHSNMIGRLDPASGAIREWDSPSGPTSHPYAIAVIDGIVWYNESGVRPDMLVRFDPASENFQSWAIPSGGVYAGIVRHMRETRDGNLLIHQSSTNRIIRVDLTGAAAL